MYHGIELGEWRLLGCNIVYTFLFLLSAAVVIVVFATYHGDRNKKLEKRMSRLRERAETDPYAKNQLVKLERKQSKKMRRGLPEKIFMYSLSLGLSLAFLSVAVIPGWTDYVKKDYLVYMGRVEVKYRLSGYSYSCIIFEDGTTVRGTLDLDPGEHYAKIVYSKRTEIALGKGE